MLKFKKEKISDYLLQLIMVILGVFLGMMASDWNASKSTEKNKKNLLLGLKSEINNNLKYLKSRKESDLTVFFNSLDSLSKSLKSNPEKLKEPFKNQTFTERVPNFPGLGRPQLDDAMFEATKYSNMLSNFDIELLKQLTKTYNLQYNIESTRNALDLKLAGIDSQTIYKDVLDLMWEVMESYFGSQYNLINEYEKTIELIDQSLAK